MNDLGYYPPSRLLVSHYIPIFAMLPFISEWAGALTGIKGGESNTNIFVVVKLNPYAVAVSARTEATPRSAEPKSPRVSWMPNGYCRSAAAP